MRWDDADVAGLEVEDLDLSEGSTWECDNTCAQFADGVRVVDSLVVCVLFRWEFEFVDADFVEFGDDEEGFIEAHALYGCCDFEGYVDFSFRFVPDLNLDEYQYLAVRIRSNGVRALFWGYLGCRPPPTRATNWVVLSCCA